MNKKILFAAVLMLPVLLFAQIGIKMELNRKDFMLYEPIYACVTLRNDSGKALLSDFFHVVFDAVVAPVPRLENLAVLNTLGKTVVSANSLGVSLCCDCDVCSAGGSREASDRDAREQHAHRKHNACHFLVQFLSLLNKITKGRISHSAFILMIT